jgi:hypothetical protein
VCKQFIKYVLFGQVPVCVVYLCCGVFIFYFCVHIYFSPQRRTGYFAPNPLHSLVQASAGAILSPPHKAPATLAVVSSASLPMQVPPPPSLPPFFSLKVYMVFVFLY